MFCFCKHTVSLKMWSCDILHHPHCLCHSFLKASSSQPTNEPKLAVSRRLKPSICYIKGHDADRWTVIGPTMPLLIITGLLAQWWVKLQMKHLVQRCPFIFVMALCWCRFSFLFQSRASTNMISPFNLGFQWTQLWLLVDWDVNLTPHWAFTRNISYAWLRA